MKIAHFVGLKGIGGVQSQFLDFINYQNNPISIKHKIYTLGKVDCNYALNTQVLNILNPINFFLFLFDVISKDTINHFYNNLTSFKLLLFLYSLPAKRIIFHERGSAWNLPQKKRWVVLYLARKADLILANSNASKIILEKKFLVPSNKIRVLYNGINLSNRRSTNLKKNKSDFFVIGFLGRVNSFKGIKVLVDVMEKINDPKIQLVVAGDGDLFETLKNRVSNMRNIKLLGRVRNIENFFSGIDVLVVPSIREPFGNVCLEAGKYYRPVIASNIDGLPEIIDDKVSGELIDLNIDIDFSDELNKGYIPEYVIDPNTKELTIPKTIDSNILLQKLIEFKNNPEKVNNYSKNLRDSVHRRFNIHRYNKDLINIYRDVHGMSN